MAKNSPSPLNENIERNKRWADARRVITGGIELLDQPEDRSIRSRFLQILDSINKQLAGGLTDAEIVLNAIRSGASTISQLRTETFFPGEILDLILVGLEERKLIRRISRSGIELRNETRERSVVLSIFRDRQKPDPITLEILRQATGFSRRHLNEVLDELRKRNEIARTRTGFILGTEARLASQRRAGEAEHDEECLCRRCLTPGYLLKKRSPNMETN